MAKLPRSVVLYHITKAENLGTIRRGGLKPRWSETLGTRVVYLASSPTQTVVFREDDEETDLQRFEDRMVVLRVVVPSGTSIEEDPEGGGSTGCYYIGRSIPPSNIKVVRYVKAGDEPLRSFLGEREEPGELTYEKWLARGERDKLGKQTESALGEVLYGSRQ